MSTLKTIAAMTILLLSVHLSVSAQQTVFELFKNDASLGDHYFRQNNYQDALKLFLNALKKDPLLTENNLQIARCYYSLTPYQRSIDY